MKAVLLDQILAVLTEIRDALKPPPLPGRPLGSMPYEQLARAMDAPVPAFDPLAGMRRGWLNEPDTGGEAFEGPTMGAAAEMMAAIPPGPQTWTPAPGKTGPASTSPLMAMLSAPLPGKAGPDSLYPDPTECPGWLNENVTQANIMQTIGVVGFTATIRPSAAEMGAMKASYCKAHGIPDPTKGEWDHFVSLELGGHPRDARNLWWQKYSDGVTCMIGAREKDRVENFLKRQIVSGALTLAEGQQMIREDWYAVYLKANKLGMLPMMLSYDPSGDLDEDDNG